ncbi:hypothetical protein RSOLAG22IIIB_07340 [Rhizoctonia solani]|uniref:Uncharacterized protein n=1 Tax=Rhizoctonia solani TaxID=456999 RepID=A0A0K6FMS2_9AGAM|nr:hypothetical protein RSOLAG22IIIB_07340 [Rhizoctonia solani]
MVSFKPTTKLQPAHTNAQSTGSHVSVSLLTLPDELLQKIASHVVFVPGIYLGSAFISAKPRWATIAGLANASHDARIVALRAWFRVLVLKDEEDWEVASKFSIIARFVRELYVHATALGPTTATDALLTFPALRAAHINAHNDVTFDVCEGYKYYTLLPIIPKGLKRLALTHAHAPDGERLEALARIDGELEELRLGRCTLFDCATQGCSYWPAFPHDHDAYFSDAGAVEYATSIAQDLAPIRNLRVVHLGVYLTPHDALSTHQHQHSHVPVVSPSFTATIPNLGSLLHPPPPHHLHLLQHPNHRAPLHSPTLWSTPCEACLTEFGPATQVAEHAASSALGDLVPGLEEISWAGYFERSGQGVSVWRRTMLSKGKGDWARRDLGLEQAHFNGRY